MSIDEAVERFLSLSARSRQLVRLIVLERLERSECATLFGMSRIALDVHFLRALEEFTGAPPALQTPEKELAYASILANGHGGIEIPSELRQHISAMEYLTQSRMEVLARLKERLRNEQVGKKAIGALWLERLAWLTLLLLSAYFYLRQRH